MPKIAICLPDLRAGGAERVSVDLAHALRGLGCDVEFVLANATGELLLEAEGDFPVFDLGCTRIRQVPLRLSSYLRSSTPSAVISNMWPLTSAVVLGRAMSGIEARVLVVEHNTLSVQYRSWGRLQNVMMRVSLAVTHRFADAIAAVSDGASRDVARLAGVSDKEVMVIHNPIPVRVPSAESIEAAIAAWNCPAGSRILMVGSLKAQKNQELCLKALKSMVSTSSKLMLVGSGAKSAELQQTAKSLGIADRVVFAGFQSDPSAFFATADLFVLSSDYEGFGNVIVEALSFGLPVVSTDCPSGPAEILENGTWGRLVPVGDAEELARAMEEVLAAPVDREALKHRAADFSPKIAARKYLDVLGLS